ncbi:MAG: ribonuclease III [Burkholderiales bacterium]|nr:ribonuclease III [Burkholderiales bacterium]
MAAADPFAPLGYVFRDPTLLRQALTHRSASATHNERLEFIGDAVLGCVIASEVYARLPQRPEGDLSRARARLVNEASLAAQAAALDLGPRIDLGNGERRSGGAARPSMLADAFEALVGAVYLDGGFDAAQRFVRAAYGDRLATLGDDAAAKDPKTALQEWLQGRRRALPAYRVIATDAGRIAVECTIDNPPATARGEARSRRVAEQIAAAALLSRLEGREEAR